MLYITFHFLSISSNALGGHLISFEKENIVLIENCSTIMMFGYFQGKHCSRASYFLSYIAYALACGIEDPQHLGSYGKHKLIRYQEQALITTVEATIEEHQGERVLPLQTI